MESIKIKEREFPILAIAITKNFGHVPILDIPWREDVKRQDVVQKKVQS